MNRIRVEHGAPPFPVRMRHLAWIAAREKKQGGKCGICETTTPGGRFGKLVMDHCHKTGFVRGLLCTPCNMRLGKWKDDAKRMRAAAIRFERTNPQRAKRLRTMASYVERWNSRLARLATPTGFL